MAHGWLEDVVIVNETSRLDRAGSVEIFRNASEACRYIEPWWVNGGEVFAYTATGDRVLIEARRSSVEVAKVQPHSDGCKIVHEWLMEAATALSKARRVRAEKGKCALGRSERGGVMPETIEGLIPYLGFTK